MNDRSDIERVLGYWLEDGPVAMPDRVIDVVARRISLRPQRRSWRLLRRSPMSPALKYGAAAAAVLAIAVVGYNLLPRSPSIGVPDSSPTAQPVQTASPAPVATAAAVAPTPVCDEFAVVCAGKLTAGTVSSTIFVPKLTFTVPDGWTNTLESTRKYTLHYNFARAHFLQVITQVSIPEQTTDCSRALKPGAGNRVADWVSFLVIHPGLIPTEPKAITIGGYAGFQLDLHVSPSWVAKCPNSLGPAVVLMAPSGAENKGSTWIDNQNVTMRILDVAGEVVIIHMESSVDAADLAALNAEFQPIFDAFQFFPAN